MKVKYLREAARACLIKLAGRASTSPRVKLKVGIIWESRATCTVVSTSSACNSQAALFLEQGLRRRKGNGGANLKLGQRIEPKQLVYVSFECSSGAIWRLGRPRTSRPSIAVSSNRPTSPHSRQSEISSKPFPS